MKIFALKNILDCENVPHGKWIVWVDDDIVINDYSNTVSMLDKYINLYKEQGNILITEDNDYVKLNTGIILVKKTVLTRTFFLLWSHASNDPKKGYFPQTYTLHEQQALKEFLEDPLFRKINNELSLVKVVPSRDNNSYINLNTFKREQYLKAQRWFQGGDLVNNGEEGRQTYQDGDSFIHHGTKQYRTQLIQESLEDVLKRYSGNNDGDDNSSWIYKWLSRFWSTQLRS